MLRIKTYQSDPKVASDMSVKELETKANTFLHEDDLSAAYATVRQLIQRQPDSVQVHMMAGLLALKLEDSAGARTHFERTLELSPDDFEASYNLALLDMMNGKPDEALSRFAQLRRMRPNDASLLNDIGVIWTEKNNSARALGAYSRGLRLDPNDSRIRNNAMQMCFEQGLCETGLKILERQENSSALSGRSRAEIHRWKEILDQALAQKEMPKIVKESESVPSVHPASVDTLKIACFASHAAFIKDIMSSMTDDKEVRFFEGQTADDMQKLMNWADIAWFEWCDNHVIEATRLPKTCKIICRLHSYEVFTDMPGKVDWGKVDHLVFVNESVLNLFRQQVSADVPTSVIYNGVNLERFTIPQGKQRSKKIASVGYINYKKNPALLLYCFKKIHEYDSEYSLHIAGQHQDSRIQLYFDHFLRKNPLPVYFDGWVEDMPSWYADKGYVISTSLFESFHYSIAEGMASGLLPLIHDWYGADFLYPRDYLFSDPGVCLELLRQLEKSDIRERRQTNRQYIARRYNQNDKVSELMALIEGLARQPIAAQTKG